MSRIPTAWMDELDDQVAFLMDPDGREAVLSEMALAAHWAGRIDACVLADMLELAEAGRLWAMEDLETVFPMPAGGVQKGGWGISLSRGGKGRVWAAHWRMGPLGCSGRARRRRCSELA